MKNLSQCLQRLKNIKAMQSHVIEITRLSSRSNPDLKKILRQGVLLVEEMPETEKYRYDMCRLFAGIALALEDYSTAYELFMEMSAMKPEARRFYFWAGDAAVGLGDSGLALHCYGYGLQLLDDDKNCSGILTQRWNRDRKSYHTIRGMCLARLEQMEEALVDFDYALPGNHSGAQFSNDIIALMAARACDFLGWREKTRYYLELSLDHNPKNKDSQEDLRDLNAYMAGQLTANAPGS